MAPREWHLTFCRWLLSQAQHYLDAEDYCAAAEATLRGLQEAIDAHAADDGLHFHDDYPSEGWTRRVEWIRTRAPNFEAALQRFIDALVLTCAGTNFEAVKERVRELESLITELSLEIRG